MRNHFWGALASLWLLSGCAFLGSDRIHYSWAPDDDILCDACGPIDNESVVIGVALSGGGSRASVYGAAALEILADENILQRATYLSSVSGGGFPAAYYALRQPLMCEDAPKSADCESNSFAGFKQAMRHDYLRAMTLRQLSRPNRISSPTRRLSSLQDALDEQFVGGAVFGDLPQTPILLINGARYDDARRFVFSNQAIPEDDSDVAQFSELTLRSASFSQPGCTRAAPTNFPVALAVAISAGFPPLLGPAAIEVGENCEGGQSRFSHLGDGGILENTGVETIEDYALRALPREQPTEKVLIFSVDAGRSTTPDEMMKKRNLRLWTTDPGRVVEIVNKRAQAYRRVATEQLAADTDASVTIIRMRYTDANLETWPISCGDRAGGTAAIRDALATIPTNLRITDCDADLMEMAARDVVRRSIRENRNLIDQTLGRVTEF